MPGHTEAEAILDEVKGVFMLAAFGISTACATACPAGFR